MRRKEGETRRPACTPIGVCKRDPDAAPTVGCWTWEGKVDSSAFSPPPPATYPWLPLALPLLASDVCVTKRVLLFMRDYELTPEKTSASVALKDGSVQCDPIMVMVPSLTNEMWPLRKIVSTKCTHALTFSFARSSGWSIWVSFRLWTAREKFLL